MLEIEVVQCDEGGFLARLTDRSLIGYPMAQIPAAHGATPSKALLAFVRVYQRAMRRAV